MITKKPLHLVLTYHWYDEIKSGRKRIEYRGNKPYWFKRIITNDPDLVTFARGYTNETMTFKIKQKLIEPDQIVIFFGEQIK